MLHQRGSRANQEERKPSIVEEHDSGKEKSVAFKGKKRKARTIDTILGKETVLRWGEGVVFPAPSDFRRVFFKGEG